jgi:hypothetical protein
VGIGRDQRAAWPDQSLLDGDVGADAGVDVVETDSALAREHPAGLLVGGVLLVGAAGVAVEGEKGLGDVVDREAVVAEVLDDVGPAEIAGDAGVDPDVDDLAGPDLAAGVAGEDLFDDGLAHGGLRRRGPVSLRSKSLSAS